MRRYRMMAIAVLSALWMQRAQADQIQYLALPQESLAAFASAIASAQTSIDLATFIYQPCDTSVRILTDEIIARAKAGVKVRVILDALQQPTDQLQNIATEFAANGIELRLYSNSLFDINMRMHAKFMIVDGRQFIAGGRNFADEYFDLSPVLNYVDRDIWVTGASAAQADADFGVIWNSDMVAPVTIMQNDHIGWDTFCGSDLHPAISTLTDYLNANSSAILKSVPVRSCAIQFAADNPDFFKAQYGPEWDNGNGAAGFLTESRLKLKLATQAVLAFLSGTQENLVVENYMYTPITNLEQQYSDLRDRGVPIQVIDNQDIEPDGPELFVQAEEYEMAKRQAEDNTGSEWIGLISSQGALSTAFELTPPAPFFLHSKVATHDQKDVLIGSFNMDSRSANINVETASTISNCPGLVSDVMAGYQNVYAQYQQDQTSPNVPPPPQISDLAKFLGDLFIYEF